MLNMTNAIILLHVFAISHSLPLVCRRIYNRLEPISFKSLASILKPSILNSSNLPSMYHVSDPSYGFTARKTKSLVILPYWALHKSTK